MPKYQSINHAIDHNTQRQCKAKGCLNPRFRISGYCSAHSEKNHKFGSPYHYRLSRKDYAKEYDDCMSIIGLNQEHEGIQYAIKFIESWLQDAWDGKPGIVLPNHARRLFDAGITGKQILVECCALYLLRIRQPQRLHDGKHLLYVMGSRILRISPYWNRTLGTEHRACGEFLMNNLGPLFVSVVSAVKRREAQEDHNQEVMHEPLEIA